ncbi:MAG TPA: DUF1285 domain-containing protein [Microvirga sp.]|jgi:hypothetical protein|nr:DUF1285 domain-containing protein [Microvirga sp.]
MAGTKPDTTDTPPQGALARLAEALGPAAARKGPPPVEKWNPAYCGEIDMRIAADGSWHYNGSPIGRPALVRLFSTILRKDPERYVLVTPVERVGITVEDVPFLAVEMAVDGIGEDRRIAFRTNVDDLVTAGPDHPLRFDTDETGGVKPYIRVRGDLWARVTRALALDLVDFGEERTVDGRAIFGVASSGSFFPIAPATDLG